MRLLTVVLGAIGTIAALAGVWSFFLDWLNILGVFVPPIGAVILTDHAVNRGMVSPADVRVRWHAFAAWAVGAVAAGIVHFQAPQYVEVLVGMAAAALAYTVLAVTARRSGGRVRADSRLAAR
jgi:cytosine permease